MASVCNIISSNAFVASETAVISSHHDALVPVELGEQESASSRMSIELLIESKGCAEGQRTWWWIQNLGVGAGSVNNMMCCTDSVWVWCVPMDKFLHESKIKLSSGNILQKQENIEHNNKKTCSTEKELGIGWGFAISVIN